MTVREEQKICIKFCIEFEHSSAETIWVIQKATVIGNQWLAASSWQHACSCITSCTEIFLQNIKSPRWLSPPYSPDWVFCDFWLFPKPKSPLKGKRLQTVHEIQENTTGQQTAIGLCEVQGAYLEGGWGIIVLCTMFLVSSSIDVSIFHGAQLDTSRQTSYSVGLAKKFPAAVCTALFCIVLF